tara:strand:+ start:183 stop:803 length:621 start_codon:yes stop_codon:yes gene_type:complete
MKRHRHSVSPSFGTAFSGRTRARFSAVVPGDEQPFRSLVVHLKHNGDPDKDLTEAQPVTQTPALRIAVVSVGTFAHYRRRGWLPLGMSVRVPVYPGEHFDVIPVESDGTPLTMHAEFSHREVQAPRDRLWDVISYADGPGNFPIPPGAISWRPITAPETLARWVYPVPGGPPTTVNASPGAVLAPAFQLTNSGNGATVRIAWEIEL